MSDERSPGVRREVTLRFLAQPTDVNFGGKVHGGAVMRWLDQAGFTCATAWSGQYCVTAFVGDINFHSPVSVGDLVEVRARIVRTGRTSMHVAVDLDAGPPQGVRVTRGVHSLMVFVAVDEDGEPVEVPKWAPESDEDQRLAAYAERIMELREVNRRALEDLRPQSG